METSITVNLWKIFTVILGVLIMPLAGWVWTMNVEVSQLRNDVGDLERHVASLEAQVDEQEEASKTLIRVESDLSHLREILDRIENLVTQ
jgi:cell division protein FtsL